jgi:hypothetical protein
VRSFGKLFALVYIVAFALSVFGMLRLEDLGKVDSLGLWYTIYSAAVASLLVAAIFAGILFIIRQQWRPRGK